MSALVIRNIFIFHESSICLTFTSGTHCLKFHMVVTNTTDRKETVAEEEGEMPCLTCPVAVLSVSKAASVPHLPGSKELTCSGVDCVEELVLVPVGSWKHCLEAHQFTAFYIQDLRAYLDNRRAS